MDKLKSILEELKSYEKILSDDNSDEISPIVSNEINEVLERLNEEIITLQQNDINKLTVKFINKSKNPDPTFSYEGDSGFDLRASLDTEIQLEPGEYRMIPTGLYFELVNGLEIQVRPRSGLAVKHGITVLNSPGTVDSHYRGEVQVPLINHGKLPFTISPGDRIGQAVIAPVFGEGKVNLLKSETLNSTNRGEKGFNSSGVK